MQRAIELNANGVRCLTCNEGTKAMDYFKAALRTVSNACRDSKQSFVSHRRSSTVTVRVNKSPSLRTFHDATARTQHYQSAFLVQLDGDDSYEAGSLISSVIIHNFALCSEPRRASLLYNHTLELLNAVSDCFDRDEVDQVAASALHNLASTYYQLGDYWRQRCALDNLLVHRVRKYMEKGCGESLSTEKTAPAA